jgi:chromosome partitioning protein
VAGSIITVATMKGGSGKSTVASCLAVHWRLARLTSAIVDADPQASVARLAARELCLGGVPVMADASASAPDTARRLAESNAVVIIDTPGFQSDTTAACVATSDILLVPIKASPLDVDRMLDTLDVLLKGRSGGRPILKGVLTQTTRDSVVAKHIRSELIQGGVALLENEMTNRVAYPEAALWGATPSLMNHQGPAAREIAAIADEIYAVMGIKQAA